MDQISTFCQSVYSQYQRLQQLGLEQKSLIHILGIYITKNKIARTLKPFYHVCPCARILIPHLYWNTFFQQKYFSDKKCDQIEFFKRCLALTTKEYLNNGQSFLLELNIRPFRGLYFLVLLYQLKYGLTLIFFQK